MFYKHMSNKLRNFGQSKLVIITPNMCIVYHVLIRKYPSQYFKLYCIAKFEMFSGGSRNISGVAASALTKESSVNRGDVIGLLMCGIYTP